MNQSAVVVNKRLAYWGLFVLTSINMVNYLDRFLVSALVESIKKSELQLSDSQLGLLASAFLVVYTLTAPLFGILGDRGSRPRWLAFGVLLWSGATALSGLARNYLTLFFARALVGIGEAAYVTISPSLLADYFSKKLRGRIFSVFFCAIPVGSALGYVFGGLMDKHFGWRAAFLIGGIPGALLAVFAFLLRDPPRGSGDGDSAVAPGVTQAAMKTYRSFLANRPYLLTVLGYAAYTFAVGGLGFWMPAFLERIRGIPRASATIDFGAIVVVTGFLGTFLGGWLGDRWALTRQHAYLWLSTWTMVAAVPFTCVALMASSPTIFYPAIVVAELLVFMSTGPINSTIVNSVAPNQRASAMALCVFVIHALGDVISPPLIGVVSDFGSLAYGVLLVPVSMAVCAVVWWRASHVAERTK
jgi:MFS family permease